MTGLRLLVLCVIAFATPPSHAQGKGDEKKAAEAQVDAVRAVVLPAFTRAQEALKARKPAEALDALKEAEAVGSLSPFESWTILRLRTVAQIDSGDLSGGQQGVEAMRAHERNTAQERRQFSEVLAGAFYNAKRYADAVTWARRNLNEDGGSNEQVVALLSNALYFQPDYVAAAAALQAELKATEAAGKTPTEERFRLLASAYRQNKDEPNYVAAIERIAVRYPKPDYWADLVARVGRKGSFSETLVLDHYRLLQVTAGLTLPEQVLDMAQLALQAGYPIEARKVLEQGSALLSQGQGATAARVKQLRDTATREAALDEKRIAEGSLRSSNTKDGSGSVSFGLAYVIGGQVDKGLAMMEEGIARGGLKRPDDAHLRLGMAYLMAGKKDKALEHLAAVKSNDGAADLARLWTLYAQRAGG